MKTTSITYPATVELLHQNNRYVSFLVMVMDTKLTVTRAVGSDDANWLLDTIEKGKELWISLESH